MSEAGSFGDFRRDSRIVDFRPATVEGTNQYWVKAFFFRIELVYMLLLDYQMKNSFTAQDHKNNFVRTARHVSTLPDKTTERQLGPLFSMAGSAARLIVVHSCVIIFLRYTTACNARKGHDSCT